jgi:hypothetical protein
LGEGLETVLAAATRMQYCGALMQPAWAAGSSSNIAKFPILPDINDLIILVDHDPTGAAAAATCQQNWKPVARNVRRLRTQDSKINDFNDLVLAKLWAGS